MYHFLKNMEKIDLLMGKTSNPNLLIPLLDNEGLTYAQKENLMKKLEFSLLFDRKIKENNDWNNLISQKTIEILIDKLPPEVLNKTVNNLNYSEKQVEKFIKITKTAHVKSTKKDYDQIKKIKGIPKNVHFLSYGISELEILDIIKKEPEQMPYLVWINTYPFKKMQKKLSEHICEAMDYKTAYVCLNNPNLTREMLVEILGFAEVMKDSNLIEKVFAHRHFKMDKDKIFKVLENQNLTDVSVFNVMKNYNYLTKDMKESLIKIANRNHFLFSELSPLFKGSKEDFKKTLSSLNLTEENVIQSIV